MSSILMHYFYTRSKFRSLKLVREKCWNSISNSSCSLNRIKNYQFFLFFKTWRDFKSHPVLSLNFFLFSKTFIVRVGLLWSVWIRITHPRGYTREKKKRVILIRRETIISLIRRAISTLHCLFPLQSKYQNDGV